MNTEKRIPELDGLRGIAIGLVLIEHFFIYHAMAKPATIASYAQVPFRLAWSGVDLFFVLSGFLIGGILLDARGASNYFRVFYARRFFRIIPLYAVCLAGTLLLFFLIQHDLARRLSWMYQKRLPWAPYFFFLQNFWMARWAAVGAFSLAVTWSLAVEEQFYLTLPMLVRFFDRRNLVKILFAGVVAAPIFRIGLYVLWPKAIFSWFMLMPCRADALLLGVLGAMLMRDASCRAWVKDRRWMFELGLFPVFLIGLAIFTMKASNAHVFPMLSLGYSWLALFYLSVILYSLLWSNSWVSSCLRWRWLKWLGTIAYGTYLVHEFVLGALYGIIWSRPPVASNARELSVSLLALVLTLLICRASWRYFEKPLIQVGHRWKYSFDFQTAKAAVPVIAKTDSAVT